MKYKNLAIKGHSTRGEEVIKILKMLGGRNSIFGGGNTNFIYYIKPSCDYIMLEDINNCNLNEFTIFTLEDFLEKYPYKVGDKVKNARINDFIGRITNVRWDGDEKQIIYVVEWDDVNKSTLTYFATGLQPYKEEIWTYYANDDDSKTDITIDGEKLIAPRGYTVKNATTNGNSLIVEYVKNKPQYPKTYAECSQIINKVAKTTNELDIAYNPNLIYDFQKLLICRDAYWKIAGDWKPKFSDSFPMYAIGTFNGTIEKRMVIGGGILLFPTEEMRDAFYENFKDKIERCKEFL